jgi:hypothetical protein
VREVDEVIDLTTADQSPPRDRVLAKKASSWYANMVVFNAREMLIEAGFRLLGNKYLERCAFVVAHASPGGFARFLFYGFESLRHDLNTG